MRQILPVVVLLLAALTTQAQNNFRSRQSGDWNNSATWEEFVGASWQNTANMPDESAGTISIEPFMTVTLSSEVTANQIVVEEDALLDVLAGGILILTDDTGDELTVFVGDGVNTFDGNMVVREGAIIENRGSISSIVTNLSFSGEYIHNLNGGAIPAAGWASGSKILISGVTNLAPTGFGISPHTLEWNCPGQSADLTIDTPLGNVGNDLLITNTNEQRLLLNDAGSLTSTIANDLVIGPFAQLALSNSGDTELTINGNLINEGILRLSFGGGSADIILLQDITSQGDINSTGSILFDGTTPQTVAITGGTSGAIDYIIPNDADVDLATSILDGSGSFNVGDDVVLHLGSTDAAGVLQNGTSGGNIRVAPGSRTFGSDLLIVFNGADMQYLGDGHPQGINTSFRVDNPAGVSLVADLVITGDADLAMGSLIMNAHSLTATKTLFSGAGFHLIPDKDASLFIEGSGNFGRLPLAFGDQHFKTLSINRNGGSNDVELTSNIVIHDDLILSRGTLELENNILEIRKDIVVTSGDIRTTSASGIRISGIGPLSGIPFSGMNNDLGTLIQNRDGLNLILGENVAIHSLLGLAMGVIDNSNGRISLVDGTTILRSEGTLIGDVPTLISGVYHVTYEGSAKTTGPELPDSSTPDYLGNLTISGGPVTLDRDIVINGDLALSGGELIVPTQDIILNGPSFINNAGTFTHTSGTVFVTENVTMTGAGVSTFDNIEIASPNTLSAENLRVQGDITLEGGSSLALSNTLHLLGAENQNLNLINSLLENVTINKTGGEVTLVSPLRMLGNLTVQSATNLNSNGHLNLESDPDIFGGGIVRALPAGASIVGDVTVEWHQADFDPAGVDMYFGSTVADAMIADLQDDILVTGSFTNADTGPVDPSFFLYNEITAGGIENGWEAYPDTDDQAPLAAGKGYRAVVMESGPVTLDVTGALNQGDIQIPLDFTDSGNPLADGWNLVSNPFPSAIGWDQLNGWDKTNVRGLIAVNIGGKFKYYNGSGAGQGTGLLLDRGEIAKNQAFWVQALSSGNLTIGEQAKVDAGSGTTPVSPSNQMVITLSDGINSDQALLVVSPGATAGYDPGLDAPKFNNAGMDISTQAADGTPLAFNFLDPLGCGATIALTISDVETGDYTLSINTIVAFDVPYLVTLEDNFLDITHNVNNNPNYAFSIDAGDAASYDGRFSLIFEADLDDLVNENLSYSTATTICEGEIGTVTFATSQAGVTYQLEVNDAPYGNPQVGTGSTMFFDINSEDLGASNTLKVLASPAECATPVYLVETKTITVNDLEVQILAAGGKLASNYTAGNTWYFGDLTNQISTANEVTPDLEGTYILVVTSGLCSQAVSYEYVITSLEELVGTQINMYPNPVTGGGINVQLPAYTGGDVEAEVLAVSGSLLKSSGHSSAEFMVDMAGIPAGVYLIRVRSGAQVYMQRVVKQ